MKSDDSRENYPKISVVCPTYNSETFIINTLNTVRNQTRQPFELIISDDGSTDDTILKVKEWLHDYNGAETIILSNSHRGPGATRNEGILKAKGDWIAFLDSDDLWYPDKIAMLTDAIIDNSDVNFVFHNENRIGVDGSKSLLHDFGSFFNHEESLTIQVWRYCIFHTSAVSCKKKLLMKVGLFDEKLMSSQDWDLWIKLAPHINYFFISDILGTYVDRPHNITATKSYKGLLDRMKIMTIHWSNSGAGIGEYAYRVCRRIGGFLITEAKIKISRRKSN
jgi:glycosyltransferase involved in cell wall biosynthesis